MLRPIAIKHSGGPLELVDRAKWLRILEALDAEG